MRGTLNRRVRTHTHPPHHDVRDVHSPEGCPGVHGQRRRGMDAAGPHAQSQTARHLHLDRLPAPERPGDLLCQAGVLNLFLRSTTAALSVNENADPDVRTDLENALDRIVPGTESLDAVARSSFVGVSMDVPVQGGKLAFGT